MKKLTPEILRWIITGFFVVSAVVFLPSLASGLMLGAAILTAPLPKLDEVIREGLHLKKTARIAIVTIIFFAAAMMTPAAEMSRANAPAAPTQSATSQTQLPISQVSSDDTEADLQPDPEPAVVPDTPAPVVVEDEPKAEDLPEVVNEPVAEPTPEPPQEAVVEPVTPSQPIEEAPAYTENENDAQERTVYVGDTGECYHTEYCRTLRGNKYAVSLSDAIASGRRACKVCGG